MTSDDRAKRIGEGGKRGETLSVKLTQGKEPSSNSGSFEEGSLSVFRSRKGPEKRCLAYPTRTRESLMLRS